MNNVGQDIRVKKEVMIRLIKAFLSDNFEENTRLIPYDMRPKGAEVPYRCCVYKERAVLRARLIAGLGFEIEHDDERTSLRDYAKQSVERNEYEGHTLTVLQSACKGCTPSQIHVTDLCMGCVARPCQSACKFGAISIKDGRSHIDPAKCKKCKMCMAVCPYNAIVKITVPCEEACPVGAIQKGDDGFSWIDYEKCIRCGKCIMACPFGAVHEKSQIIDILKNVKNENQKVVAMIAPAIAGQFPGTLRQLHTAILQAGFDKVYEVAQGADITTRKEAAEFTERMKKGAPFMTTSCCAGYNQLIKKHLQVIKPFESTTCTPLYYTAEIARKENPGAVLVFISPCIAKRAEAFNDLDSDFVLSCEELGALFIAKQIDILKCEETPFETESSKQGRNFCLFTGVSGAVVSKLDDPSIAKPCLVNGLTKESIAKLRRYAKTGSCPEGNLIEVMCCEGGCIAGNATLNNMKVSKKIIDGLAEKSRDLNEMDAEAENKNTI